MSFSGFLQKWFGVQNLAARLICRIPPEVHHNIGKLEALRKAFAYTGLEGVEGDYLEFGVFQGTSLIAAIHSYETQNRSAPCRFFGFDSFEGFWVDEKTDGTHPVWRDRELATSYDMVAKRLKPFRKRHQIELVKGYYSEVLSDELFQKLNVKKVRVMLIDCDLKSSTRDALKYSARYWKPGTVLIIDDFFSYLGSLTAGECGAFMEFCAEHPEFQYRDFGHYGYNGVMMIVSTPPRSAIS